MESEVTDDEEKSKLCHGEDELRQELATQQCIFLYRSNQQAPECAIFFLLQNGTLPPR